MLDSLPRLRRTKSASAIAPEFSLDSLPRLRRTKSARATAPEFSIDTTRFDTLFGSSQPARGKLLETEDGIVHRTPIQKQEIEGLGNGKARVKINSTRLFVSTAQALRDAHSSDNAALAAKFNMSQEEIERIMRTPTFHSQTEIETDPATSQVPLAQRLRLGDLRKKRVEYKWNITNNYSLVIGEVHPGVPLDEPMTTKPARKKKQPFAQGHVTLVGGQTWQEPWQSNRQIPESRICGTLYYNKDGKLCINNDSGRFSEYEDRTLEHLEMVASIFKKYGVEVEVEWIEKDPVALQNQPDRSQKAAPATSATRQGAKDVGVDPSTN
ncbi:hypothetical protein O1K_05602 [Xanthomonas fragariae LMG 25863]|nr:hypothetical protein O1K_05602 [Xanthomonas fragariae LMG 25863]